jgi:large conductance mechanosensitive channel
MSKGVEPRGSGLGGTADPVSVLSDFKKFALRGNVVELAIGFTVGAAFTTIAKSLVSDLIMPPIGLILGRTDFTNLFVVIKEGSKTPAPYPTLAAAQQAGAVTINYGLFLNSLVSFIVVALAMFLVIRIVNRIDERLEAEFGAKHRAPDEPTEKKCPYCLSIIPYCAVRCGHCTSELEPVSQRA